MADELEEVAAESEGTVETEGIPGRGGKKDFYDVPLVADTATPLVGANGNRAVCEIQNVGTTTVWLGRDATVSAAHGQKLIADASYTDEHSLDAWYALSAGGAGAVRVLEVTQ